MVRENEVQGESGKKEGQEATESRPLGRKGQTMIDEGRKDARILIIKDCGYITLIEKVFQRKGASQEKKGLVLKK